MLGACCGGLGAAAPCAKSAGAAAAAQNGVRQTTSFFMGFSLTSLSIRTRAGRYYAAAAGKVISRFADNDGDARDKLEGILQTRRFNAEGCRGTEDTEKRNAKSGGLTTNESST